MRSCLLGLLLIDALVPLAAAAERKFPYEALIESDDVHARSGPGSKYYPTSKLKLGERVVVHRHDPGGWFMIAPPAGSFSWIRAKYVDRRDGDRGVVNTNRVVVRVGSHESDSHDVEQARLNQGDEVRILGEKRLHAEHEPAELWYKIAPPPREWRWIMGQFVTPVDEHGHPKQPGHSEPHVVGRRKGDLKPPSEHHDQGYDVARGVPAKRIPDEAARDTTVASERNRSESARPSKEIPVEMASVPHPSRSALEAEQAQLDRLDEKFRAMLQRDASEWDFTQIEQDYLRFRSQTSRISLQQISEARLVTVAKYKQLRAERDELTRLTSETARRDAELREQQRAAEEGRITRNSTDFSGAGIVSRATGNLPGAPPYVLITPAGRLLAYLAPRDDVDLEPWIGKAAGINGPRSYHRELRADLIRVEKLTTVQLRP